MLTHQRGVTVRTHAVPWHVLRVVGRPEPFEGPVGIAALYAHLAYRGAMAETKTQRVHLRVADSDDKLFRNAAAATHESLSEFLVESGRERAERVLADRARFVLTASQWRTFTAALDRAPREIPAVVELFRRRPPE